MRKLTRISLSLTFGLCALGAAAQTETVTVCDGTATNCNVPVYMYDWDRTSQSETIYPATELTELKGKTVEGLTFYIDPVMAKDMKPTTLRVLIGEVEDADFGAMEDWAYTDPTSLIEVFNDNVSLTKGDSKWTVEFKTPYTYRGGNLAIMYLNSNGTSYNRTYFVGKETTGFQALRGTAPIGGANFLPKTTFICGASAEYSAALSTTDAAFPMTVVGETATLPVRVSNLGTAALSGTVSIEGDDVFSVQPAEITDLQPGEYAEIVLSFNAREGGDFAATATVALGEAGNFTIAMTGSAYEIPEGTRTFFSGTDYAASMPEGWAAYARELNTHGDFIAETADYSEFPTTSRFESKTVAASPAILWNHGNPMPYTDQYSRYYYLVSPVSQGKIWVRAMVTELPGVFPFIRAFVAFERNGGFDLGREIELDWASDLNNTSWSTAEAEGLEGVRVAFFMKYAGLSVFVDSADAAVSEIETVPEDTEAVLYDLNGRVVRTPAPGLYIRRTGSRAEKVIIR